MKSQTLHATWRYSSLAHFDQRARRKRSWHDRRRISRRKEITALPVEVVSPTRTAITAELHRKQSGQKAMHLLLGFVRLDSTVMRDLREGEQRDPFCVPLCGNSCECAKVGRRTLYDLCPDKTCVAGLGSGVDRKRRLFNASNGSCPAKSCSLHQEKSSSYAA